MALITLILITFEVLAYYIRKWSAYSCFDLCSLKFSEVIGITMKTRENFRKPEISLQGKGRASGPLVCHRFHMAKKS